MLNILHVAPNLKPGGTLRMAADLSCELEERSGIHNIVLSPANELVSHIRTHGVEHRLCHKITPWNFLLEGKRLRDLISKLRPQLIQVYTPEAALLTQWACRPFTAPNRPHIIGFIASLSSKGFKRQFWKSCDSFVTVSKHLRTLLADGLLKSKRKHLRHIPFGVNDKVCSPAYKVSGSKRAQWLHEYPSASQSLTLCIPGPISPESGLEDLPTILSTLHHWKIPAHAFIVGDTTKAEPTYLEQIKTKLNQANVSANVSWVGARADLRDVLILCDITLSLVHTPATYNQPILEALALGRPVVSYDHGINGELLEAFLPEGAVAPGNSAGIADTISQWHAYRPATITEIPQTYRLASTADALLHIYDSLGLNH